MRNEVEEADISLVDIVALEEWAVRMWGNSPSMVHAGGYLRFRDSGDYVFTWSPRGRLTSDGEYIGYAPTLERAKAILVQRLRPSAAEATSDEPDAVNQPSASMPTKEQRRALEDWAIDTWGDSEGFTSDGILRNDDGEDGYLGSPAFVWSGSTLYSSHANPPFTHEGVYTLDRAKELLLAELGPPKATSDEPDAVNQPSHYTQGGVECIEGIRAALGEDGFRAFCRGCAIKYLWRAGLKGDAKTDLEKAARYIQYALGDL